MAEAEHVSQMVGNQTFDTKLNGEEMEIRLLETFPKEPRNFQIECRMMKARCSTDAYYALSYAWGDPTVEQKIIINSDKVNVTISLYSALLQL